MLRRGKRMNRTFIGLNVFISYHGQGVLVGGFGSDRQKNPLSLRGGLEVSHWGGRRDNEKDDGSDG
jgi:hypothetical protein